MSIYILHILIIYGIISGEYGGEEMNKIYKFLYIIISILLITTLSCCSAASTSKDNTNNTKIKETINNRTKTTTASYAKETFKAPFKAVGEGVPVLMYHSISNEQGNPVIISPALLEEEFKYIKDNGYTPITLDDLYNYLQNNAQIPEKSLLLTFDDGYENNYSALFPLLKKYGFRATIFVITSYVDKNSAYLTSTQIKEMNSYGVDIESHTVNHPYLNSLTKDKQLYELTESKSFLQKLLNKKINYIAYPYGAHNSDTLSAAEEAGYKLALTTDGRWAMKKNGILSLDRVYISSEFSMDIFKDRISNPNYKFQ